MSHQVTKQFQTSPDTDERLANMLALYKAPATIRDLKTVFLYCEVNSNITSLAPNNLFYNFTVAEPTTNNRVVYFAPIGTQRTINIASRVSDLLDIRVPKDKYVVEINLVECVIESDTSGWVSIPDRVVVKNGGGAGINSEVPTFTNSNTLATASLNPPRQTISTVLSQATKLTSPQSLFVRIKELANGEPYNWVVTNSGAYSEDKSHQLVVRHGDVDYANLTLEFGHLGFQGRDFEYASQITDPSKSVPSYSVQNANLGQPRQTVHKSLYDQPVYLDYNTEVFNTQTQTDSPTAPWFDDDVMQYYKGIDGKNFSVPDVDTQTGRNITQPANRPPYRYIDGVTNPYYLQGKPYFYNQQASKLGFRFKINVLHTF